MTGFNLGEGVAVRSCAIAVLLAISSVPTTAQAQVQATLATNKANFAPGDLLNVSVGVANGGSSAVLDFYFGVLLPDGVTLLYFSDLSFTTAQASLHELPTLRPIASGVTFPPGAVFNAPQFFQYWFNGHEPSGRYLFFLAATPPGGFMLDRVVMLQTREIFLAATGGTVVSIAGDRFLLNNTVTHPGTAAEGLLLNSRMVQAIFDDENPNTVWRSNYPDTGVWDAERNVREFIASLPTYAARGLRAVTVNLQGGSPGWSTGDGQPGITTGFNPDGTLKGAWLSRLDRVIRAADQHGLVVIVGLFYFGQDHRLSNEAAVVRGVDSMTDWLVGQGYRNVLVEINNEADLYYDHPILRPARVAELIARVRHRSGGTLKVSTSLAGGSVPSSAVISASDYILLHGNGQGPSGVAGMVDAVRASAAYQAHPKPIVFNEDSTAVANFDAAVSRRSSWGYYDQGQNNYRDGFQSPPVNWTLSTAAKRAFFDRVGAFTGASTDAPDPTSRANTLLPTAGHRAPR
jgi:hypothetical protein